jgi:hypothetical protein
MIDKETGQPLLIELNARPTQICHIGLGADSDMIGSLAIALGANPPMRPLPNVDTPMIALFPQECWRDPDSPYLRHAYHDVPWSTPEFIAAYRLPPAPQPEHWLKGMARGRRRSPRAFPAAASLLGGTAKPPSPV